MKYTANVSFQVLEFEADSLEDADNYIDKLLDSLAESQTEAVWDYVEWVVKDVGQT